MKHYPPPIRRRARHIRVPAFSPVPLRARSDGWTPARQAGFLAALALTRSVSEAARRVGMARENAHRLRRKPGAESFTAAWDAVLGRADQARRKITLDERARRAVHGLLKPIIYRGRHVGTSWKADNSALLGHLAQLDRALVSWDDAAEWSQSLTHGSASTPGAGSAAGGRNAARRERRRERRRNPFSFPCANAVASCGGNVPPRGTGAQPMRYRINTQTGDT